MIMGVITGISIEDSARGRKRALRENQITVGSVSVKLMPIAVQSYLLQYTRVFWFPLPPKIFVCGICRAAS
jgi:hypothetical protein